VLVDAATLQEVPQERIAALFLLYGLLVLTTVAGTVLAIFIGNKRYTNRFGVMTVLILATFLAAKGFFG